jgi:SAM-dependent methyltransferase
MNINGTNWRPTGDGALVFPHIPNDVSWQSHGFGEALRVLGKYPQPRTGLKILDVGCGMGNSFHEFKSFDEEIAWIGLDISDSPEASARTASDLNLYTFDGAHIPFADGEMDLVYSRQVFEHVRYPADLLREIHRVLKPGGHLVGSTSHLEPFHSRSYWNYTPYGFCMLLLESGFDAPTVRPGIDGLTLMVRRMFGHLRLAKIFDPFFEREAPLNLFLELMTRVLRMQARRRNALKLLYSGHFTFVASKQQ